MNLNGLADDITEIVARTILFKDKQCKGEHNPNTDEWVSVYHGIESSNVTAMEYHTQTIQYNKFRAEVDSVTSNIMRSVCDNEANHD